MAVTWISPWSGEQLGADELIREVALDALSQLYLVSLLGAPTPEIALEPDSVAVKSSALDYEYVIPYPAALAEEMAFSFADVLVLLRKEFGFLDGARDPEVPRGEEIGAMLRYFKSLDRLVRIVSAARCWNERRVLAVHGIPPGQSIEALRSDLEAAGCHYLVIYPNGPETGSGHFMAVDMPAAMRMVNSLWLREPGAVERFFDIRQIHGDQRWLSDDCTWHSDRPIVTNE